MKRSTIFILTNLLLSIILAQSHTFYKTERIYKNFSTNKEEKYIDKHDIIIKDLGNGKFILRESDGELNFKFSHLEYVENKKIYVYKITTKTLFTKIQSNIDMKLIALGQTGKFIIDSEKNSIVMIYNLK